jgi:hypothetical protein
MFVVLAMSRVKFYFILRFFFWEQTKHILLFQIQWCSVCCRDKSCKFMWKGKFLTQKSVWKSLQTFPPIYSFFNFLWCRGGFVVFQWGFLWVCRVSRREATYRIAKNESFKISNIFSEIFFAGVEFKRILSHRKTSFNIDNLLRNLWKGVYNTMMLCNRDHP